MTTLDALERQLPWGFHDAHLEALNLDWLNATLTLVLRVPLTQHQDG